MSQSPVGEFSADTMLRYQQGWRALNRLLHEDRSFSGHERHCMFLNCGRDQEGNLMRFANISSVTDFDLPDDGRGIAACDWDFDGDLDLWITNRTAPRVRFMRNVGSNGNHFLAVKLRGDGRAVNRDAIGARLELYTTAEPAVPALRTVRAGESFLSQSSAWIHFGLGQTEQIDRLVVRWPGGEAEEFRGLSADQFFLIEQGAGNAKPWSFPAPEIDIVASAPATPPESDQARIVIPAGLPFPEIHTIDEDGQVSAWKRDGRGPTLINLWATWCAPCLAELTEWSRQSQQLSDAGLEVIALNADALDPDAGDTTRADEFLQQIEFPFVAIPVAEVTVQTLNALQQSVLDRWKPLPLPSTFLVDASGEVVAIYKGPIGVEQILTDLKLLAGSAEDRRTAAIPFRGLWVDAEAPRASPRRVANQLLDQNQIDEAMSYLEQIVESSSDPTDEQLRRELGDTWYFLGVLHEFRRNARGALDAFTRARDLIPQDVRVRGDLGKLLMKTGNFAKAAEELSAAVRINPKNLELNQHLGVVLLQTGQVDQAIPVLQQVVETDPRNGTTWYFLGNAHRLSRSFPAAIDAYRQAIEVAPNLLEASNNLAWILAVHPDDQLRNGEEAVTVAQRLCEVTRFEDPGYLDTLAVAYAEDGQYEQAAETARKAISIYQNASNKDAVRDSLLETQKRLALFEQHQAYRAAEWSTP